MLADSQVLLNAKILARLAYPLPLWLSPQPSSGFRQTSVFLVLHFWLERSTAQLESKVIYTKSLVSGAHFASLPSSSLLSRWQPRLLPSSKRLRPPAIRIATPTFLRNLHSIGEGSAARFQSLCLWARFWLVWVTLRHHSAFLAACCLSRLTWVAEALCWFSSKSRLRARGGTTGRGRPPTEWTASQLPSVCFPYGWQTLQALTWVLGQLFLYLAKNLCEIK